MRGTALTPKTNELSYIFWKVRDSRKANERRSWMRRARLALAKRLDLTDAQRHEIMCVWSRRDVSHIDSPALAALHGTRAECGTFNRKASTLYRARFDDAGKKIPRLKANKFKPCPWFTFKPKHRQLYFLSHGFKPPYVKKSTVVKAPPHHHHAKPQPLQFCLT
jgi:hypothetical protein